LAAVVRVPPAASVPSARIGQSIAARQVLADRWLERAFADGGRPLAGCRGFEQRGSNPAPWQRASAARQIGAAIAKVALRSSINDEGGGCGVDCSGRSQQAATELALSCFLLAGL
jgi:hypothetical protein